MTVEQQVDRFGLAFRAIDGRVVILDGLGGPEPIALKGWDLAEFRSFLHAGAAELYRAEVQAGVRTPTGPAACRYRP